MPSLVLPEENQFEVALHLHETGRFGIHENPDDFITLKSGRISPHYLDLRPGISSPDTRRIVGGGLLDLAEMGEDFLHIVGTPEAFTSYAASMADMSERSLLQPRVAQKQSGNKVPILGTYSDWDTVAVFDDVVTDGKTKVDTIEGLEAAGLIVAG